MKFAIISSVVAGLLASEATAATVKIMPFGASIVGAPGCWRAVLWKKLQAAGITNTDFVGSNTAPDCGFPYDGDNEGHAGSLATGYVHDNLLPGWLDAAKPDVIVMLLGTNDVIQKKTIDETIRAYNTLLDEMRGCTFVESRGQYLCGKPNIKIIMSTLLPIEPSKFGQYATQGIIDLNNAIKAWAPTKSTSQSPIVIVDNFTGFNSSTDTVDGEHPNDKGDQKMADKFYQPLVNAIRSDYDGCPAWQDCLDHGHML